jgi:hypothetical protein
VIEAFKGISIMREDRGIAWEFAKPTDASFIKVTFLSWILLPAD